MLKYLFLLSLFSFNLYAQDFYTITDKTIKGEEIKMDVYKGKVLLIVNIASQCGFTSQLDDLQKLYDKYQAQGLVVLGVPTNDFGEQTPEDDKGMAEFCSKTYNVKFPLLKKGTILGKDQRPLYTFLTKKSDKDFQGDVGWNFVKFLVSKEGKVVDRFTSLVNPMNKSVTEAIEKQLKR